MSYVSLYRKYRSQTFGDLIGQDHVVRTLQNGIKSGRISHSYLFTGPRGTGKTSTARLLAKALCCEHGPAAEPDNTCDICLSITAGNCIDVIEMDAASESGVEDIRDNIVEAVEYRPMMCRYKVFIIDEVHDLSAKAFDALLKTIEEPPAHIIFILATTEFNKVPPTIRSRCQKYEFHRADIQDLTSRLDFVLNAEGVKAEPPAIAAIARMADGGYRDALTLLEQAMLTSEGEITLQQVYDQLGLVNEDAIDGLLISIREGRITEVMDRLEEITRLGRDPRAILESMMFRLADLTRAAFQMQEAGKDSSREAALHETAVQIGKDTILRLRGEIAQAHRLIRDISLPRLWLESELVRLSIPQPVATPVGAIQMERPALAKAPVERKSAPTKDAPPSPLPSTGDADFDSARLAWHQVKQVLCSVSPQMTLRLEATVLVAREGSTLAVQLERHSDLEWIQEAPKRGAAILKEVRERIGQDAEVKYVVRKREDLNEAPVAVELPLEGKALEQMLKSQFSNEGNSTP